MVLYVYFFAYFITFRKHFYYLFSQNVNNEKKWAQREVLKTERQTRHLLQQMTRLPLLFY